MNFYAAGALDLVMERHSLGAALVVAIVAAGLASACSGDGATTRSPTSEASTSAAPTTVVAPTAPATPANEFLFRFPPPGPCPLPDQPDVCGFALELVQEVRTGDIDAVVGRATPLPTQCPATPQTVLFGSVCEGRWGSVVPALYAAKWGGGAALGTVGQIRETVAERLAEGTAARAAVGGVGCSLPNCELAVVAIVFRSADVDGVWLVQLVRDASGLGIVGLLNWVRWDEFVRGQSAGVPIAFPELRSAAASLTFQPWSPQ